MKKILIVDGDPQSALVMHMVLQDWGCDVRLEVESPRALNTAREFHPDAVIVDFVMPKVHGGDVAWQFAADSELRSIPLIMYSHIAAEELRPRLPPSDIPILEKPIRTEDLARLLGITPQSF